jgi:ABC-2 type transport system permease protein
MRVPPLPEPAGSIYDLGYRHYDGERLGRAQARRALFLHGLRASYGLGRRPLSKVMPWSLAGLALVPAVVFLYLASSTSGRVDIIQPYDYFSFISLVLALFAAIVAPELVSRDQANRTLSLYFSRPITRDDYAAAKLAAFSVALLGLTLVPSLVVFAGNALSRDEPWDYLRDEWFDLPRIVVSGVVIAFLYAAIGLAVASATARRAYATGGIIALIVISAAIGNIFAEAGSDYFALLSLLDVPSWTARFIFGAELRPNGDGALVLDVWTAAAATLVYATIATAVFFRRFRTVQP